MAKLIETITNVKGDVYELYQIGKSFKSVVSYTERKNKRGTLPAEIIERKHRNLSAAESTKLRDLFKGVWVRCESIALIK